MDWNLLNNIIKDGDNFILSTHVNPDGDGLGSQLAFYYYLIDQGKKCHIINFSPLPSHYKFLDNDNVIEQYDELIHENIFKKTDVAIIFDIGDYNRLEEVKNQISRNNIYTVSIDHHPMRDQGPVDLPIVDVDSPAAGYMVWKYFEFFCGSFQFGFRRG